MPSVKIRRPDATWKALGEGKLKVKWGSAWVTPSSMKIQWAGTWRDTGYKGDPSVPTNVRVYSWDYDDVRITWTAGTGGAGVSEYHVVQTDSAGNWLRQYNVTSGLISPSIPVSQSTSYIFYVRSKSTAGLYSDWGNTVKAKIGKPAVTTYTTEEATRPWSLAASVNGYKDVSVGPNIATNRVVQNVRYQISANAGFTSILCPYNNRQIYRIANGGLAEQFNWQAQAVDVTVNVGDYWGTGGCTGMRCAGTGWATGPATSIYRAVGTITASGYETYSYQQAHTTAAVANSYW